MDNYGRCFNGRLYLLERIGEGCLPVTDSDPETYARYDAMTSRELFRQYGVSKRLYEASFIDDHSS